MKKLKVVLNIILSFALMLGITAIVVTVFAGKMLKKDYIFSKFEEIDLYNQVLKEVEAEFENHIYQSGMDVSIIENICTKEKVENDIKKVIDSLYSKEAVEIDTTEIQKKLDEEVDKFIESQNRKISEEEKANIVTFKDTLIQSYKNSIGFYQIESDSIQENLPKITSKIEMARTVVIISTLVILAGLIALNYKEILVAINYICVSLLSSGILLLLISHLINKKVLLDNLLLYIQSLTSALVTLVKGCLSSLTTFGIWFILIGIVGILVISIKNMDKNTEKIEKVKKAKNKEKSPVKDSEENHENVQKEDKPEVKTEEAEKTKKDDKNSSKKKSKKHGKRNK